MRLAQAGGNRRATDVETEEQILREQAKKKKCESGMRNPGCLARRCATSVPDRGAAGRPGVICAPAGKHAPAAASAALPSACRISVEKTALPPPSALLETGRRARVVRR